MKAERKLAADTRRRKAADGDQETAGAIAGARQSISKVEVADWEDGNNTAGGLSNYLV